MGAASWLAFDGFCHQMIDIGMAEVERNTKSLADQRFDVVVVGGGIYGACVAWDAALRGLAVALIERGDFGQETSSNSLKTVHGGLRYLQDADLGLVRSMIRERSTYLRIAPHLVHPLPCVTPTYHRLMKSKIALGIALKLNDLIGLDRNKDLEREKGLPNGRLLSRQEIFRYLPHLPEAGVSGGALWYDAQVYDTERFTLSFILSAMRAGAVAANYVEAVGFPQRQGRVIGVKARDVLSGDIFEISAKTVVNAAGPWVDEILKRGGVRSKGRKFHHSLAVNIITRKLIEGFAAGIPSYPESRGNPSEGEKPSHVLFISPWRGYSLIGTFHSHYSGPPDDFRMSEENLKTILEEINSAYPGVEITRENICFIHHGFLPEVPDGDQREVKLVRRGQVFDHREEGMEGLITVVGVKYTSARQVAEKTVDLIFRILDKVPPVCKTSSTPVHGGEIEAFGTFLEEARAALGERLSPEALEHLVRSYGSEYMHLVDRLNLDETPGRLTSDSPEIIRAQVEEAVDAEMAIKLTDVIFRRTGLGTAGRPDPKRLEVAAQTMAHKLGWSPDQKMAEIEEVQAVYDLMGV